MEGGRTYKDLSTTLWEVRCVNKMPGMLNKIPSHWNVSPSGSPSTHRCSSGSCPSDSERACGSREGSYTRACATAIWEHQVGVELRH